MPALPSLLLRHAAAILLLSISAGVCVADQIVYPTVSVGDPGNAGQGSYGSVSYAFAIGKYDVTVGNYTTFLNAVDPGGTNPHALYNASMATDPNVSGIAFDAAGTAGAKYSVIGSPNHPVTYVSWFDAARFANWMANGQGSGSTETGSYTMNGNNVVPKNPGARVYIPTENEWYKAAFFSPVKGGPGSPGYWSYATQSDTAPGNHVGSGANQANYGPGGVLSVTQSSYVSSQNYLTDVGAYTGSASHYGTFDQSGLVFEWIGQGAARGGCWLNGDPLTISSGARAEPSQTVEGNYLGFRLAFYPDPVPELDPSAVSGVLALVAGTLGLLERRRRA